MVLCEDQALVAVYVEGFWHDMSARTAFWGRDYLFVKRWRSGGVSDELDGLGSELVE